MGVCQGDRETQPFHMERAARKKKAQTNEGFPQCRIPDGSWDACERKSLCLPAREVAEFAFKRVHSGRVACV